MKKIVVLTVVALLLLFSGYDISIAEDKIDLEELVLVTGGMKVDWEYQLEEIVNGKLQGSLIPDMQTDKSVWTSQGCVNGFCFMESGGPDKDVKDEPISCHMRVFVPSELEIGQTASLGMNLTLNGKIHHKALLHVLCIQPIEANFTVDKRIIRVKEKSTSGCTPIETTSEERLTAPAAPQIRNGRMMIPFRLLGEVIGAEVSWNASTQEASYQLGPKRIILRKGIPTARVVMTGSDYKVEMDTAPDIIDGSTMIPLRFVTAILGGDVTWDDPTKTAIINFPGCGK